MTNCKNCNCNCNSKQKKTDKQETQLEIYEETHSAEAFVLTCIDYRFIDSAITFLENGPLALSYDLTALAGASLSFNQTKYKHWKQTLLDQINLAIELHEINQIIVFDHMDCGAYKIFYPNLVSNSEEERRLHIKNIKKFLNSMKEIFPNLSYTGYLVNFDGEAKKVYTI